MNNYDKIKPFLQFESDDDFYIVQVIKRKRENPEMTCGEKVIFKYYMFSIEQFESDYKEMIELCEKENARCYINLNRRSKYDCSTKLLEWMVQRANEDRYYLLRDEESVFDHMLELTEMIKYKRYDDIFTKYRSLMMSIASKNSSEDDKKWMLDIDKEDVDNLDSIVAEVNKLQIEANREPLNIILKSKNGYHIITRKFNLNKFSNSKLVHSTCFPLLYFKN